eukprot:scaffold42137_cov225-Isochrysis_galbana.AAC.1
MDILTEKGEENLSATDKKKLATCGGQMAKLDGELKGARDRLDTLEVQERVKEAKEQKKKESAEAKRAMSEAGVILLCEIRLKYQAKFDNKSDKNDSIWKHVEADFNKAVESGELPE